MLRINTVAAAEAATAGTPKASIHLTAVVLCNNIFCECAPVTIVRNRHSSNHEPTKVVLY